MVNGTNHSEGSDSERGTDEDSSGDARDIADTVDDKEDDDDEEIPELVDAEADEQADATPEVDQAAIEYVRQYVVRAQGSGPAQSPGP